MDHLHTSTLHPVVLIPHRLFRFSLYATCKKLCMKADPQPATPEGPVHLPHHLGEPPSLVFQTMLLIFKEYLILLLYLQRRAIVSNRPILPIPPPTPPIARHHQNTVFSLHSHFFLGSMETVLDMLSSYPTVNHQEATRLMHPVNRAQHHHQHR